MKKILAVVIIVLALSIPLTAKLSNSTQFIYDNEELYEVGNGITNVKVDRVEIDWIYGDIKVAYHSLDNIRITEKYAFTSSYFKRGLKWRIRIR